MVKHVILWQLKDELSDAEKAAVKAGIKEGLEGLAGKVPGLVEVHVNIHGLPSSTADLMLDTTFESAEALNRPSCPCGCGRQQGAALHQGTVLSGLRSITGLLLIQSSFSLKKARNLF